MKNAWADMDWGREITKDKQWRILLIENGTSDHQHLLCKETSAQSHPQQWQTQFDYVMVRRRRIKEVVDTKVIVGKSVVKQHRIVGSSIII